MYERFVKRALDILLSLLALPFFLLLVLLLAPVIYLSDRGPVFYAAQRVGKKGRCFRMLKFRSMVVDAPDIRNADGSTFSSDTDQRVTRCGAFLRKTSLDETPQLLNVLKGDMSLIGPRPNLPTVPYSQLPYVQRRRLDVRPGLTGYNQAYYRNSVTTAEKYEHDVYYVDNISFAFDLKILLRTVAAVLRREHINRN